MKQPAKESKTHRLISNKQIYYFLGIAIIASTIVTLLAYHLSAQPATNGMYVSPTNFDFTIPASGTVSKTITVLNLTDNPMTVKSELRNFSAQGEEGGVEISSETTNYSLASWLSVSPTEETIPAKSSHDFTFTITVPAKAEPGGHFGAVVFRTVPNPLTGTGATVTQEIASLILVRIPGNANEQATVSSFATDKLFYEFGPVNFTARIKNEGNVHIRPVGAVVVTSMWGQKMSVNVDPRNVLPGAIRQIPAILSNHLLIGKYTVQLILAYGTKNQNLYASTEFWAFPVRYGVVVFIILLILFFFRKRLWKALRVILKGK